MGRERQLQVAPVTSLSRSPKPLWLRGKRTIEQTGERLPERFQTAEIHASAWFDRLIVERKALRQTLSDLLISMGSSE